MRTKAIGVLSLVSLILTVIWLTLLIFITVTAGPFGTFEQSLAFASGLSGIFYLNYLNAALLTVVVTLLFAALYAYLRISSPIAAAMGFVFVPVYALLNLFAYISQVTIVPRLLLLRPIESTTALTAGDPIIELLRQFIQQSTGSAVWVLNNLGYAVLAIPSIIFGALLATYPDARRWAGWLLAVSGLASIIGLFGIIARSEAVSLGSLIGGAFFLVALIPLTIAYWQEEE